MKRERVSWRDFKNLVGEDIASGSGPVYRGQRDAAWTLETSLHRTGIFYGSNGIAPYAQGILPQIETELEAWIGRGWNLKDPNSFAEFLGFAQHNGFPTPLLDWSFSPYIAAYFAFEGVNHLNPQSEHAAVYRFNQAEWRKAVPQYLDISHTEPHVSVLKPRHVGNPKLAVQQGLFTYSTVNDIEGHISAKETAEMQFLTKYELSTMERGTVMRELSLMGITAVQLMPSTESVCKKAWEDLINSLPVGVQSASRASKT